MPLPAEQKPASYGLAIRMVLAFGSLALLLAAGLGFMIRHLADNLLEEQIRLGLNQAAVTTRDRLDRKMADFCRDVRNRAEAERIENPRGDTAFRRRSIDYLREAWPEFSWIAFVRADGRVEQASGGLLEGANVSARPWFGRALADEPVTDVHEAKLLQKLLPASPGEPQRFVDIAYPLRSGPGDAPGVLGVHVSWNFARALVRSSLQLNYRIRGLEILIYDRDGKVILGKPDEPPLSSALLAQLKQRDEIMLSPPESRHLVAYSASRRLEAFPGLGWVIAARQDMEDAYRPITVLNRDVLVWSAVAVVLFGLLGGLFAQRLALPLTRLTGIAGRLSSGERDVPFRVDQGPAEVQALSRALERMVGALSAQERALQDANASLEERVRQRTEQLAQTSADLARERERLTYSLEGSRIAAWDVNPATGEAWLSAEWAVMLGRPRVETRTSYEALWALVPEEDRERVIRLQQGVLKGQLPYYDAEHRVMRDDGSLFWIRSRGTVTSRDSEGKAQRFAGTNSDITRSKMAEEELRQSEQKLRLVADNLPFMICYFDRGGRFLFANRPYLEFLGVSDTNIVGKSVRDVAGPDALARLMADVPRLSAGEHVRHERVRADRHGLSRSLAVTEIPHLGEDGSLIGIFALVEDATERLEAARKLALSENRLRLVLDNVPTVVCEVDVSGQIRLANQPYHQFYQLKEGEAVGRRIADIAGKEAEERFLSCLPALSAGETVVYEREAVLVDGRRAHLEVHLVPGRTASGDVDRVYAMINDITARKQVEELLIRQAVTDTLTGLPNRRLLMDRMTKATAQAQRHRRRLALLYVDLDGFKPVNDTHGHAAGDELLRQVAERLTGIVRAGDTVSRLGGDEFVLLLDPCNGLEEARSVAGKVLHCLQSPFDLGSVRVGISGSAGIALYPDDSTEPEGLLAFADLGLYAAKAAGKGRCIRWEKEAGPGERA